MSRQAIAAFLKQATEDESLKQQLVDFAAQHGFDFTADELTDSALEQVVGGLGSWSPCAEGSSGPAPPVPIPYPNIGSASFDGAGKVKQDGPPLTKEGTGYTTSSGDEAGTG